MTRRLSVVALTALAVSFAACSKSAPPPVAAAVPLLGMPGAPATAREDLVRVVAEMEQKLASNPADASAATRLADALLRQARVNANGGLASRAEAALTRVLASDPDNYDARRMLAAVYLSEHRFRDALAAADQCRLRRPNDAWLYGAIGDAHLELGEYPEAFNAFDRMATLRPNAASYARASYARELRGDLDGALRYMAMATEATGAQDPESGAWHHAQLGHLYLELGRTADAEREYGHADFIFPGHPFAQDGLARVRHARGDDRGALDLVKRRLAAAPTPSDLAFAGELSESLGDRGGAERYYRLAEAAWISDAPEPARLVRFLAEHGRRLNDVVRLAQAAAAERHDIFTDDALAWAYFRTGDTAQAAVAIKNALRTGSRDKDIRAHAAAIERAVSMEIHP
jgi:tetratricopeptide (TPR) repeat protein